MINRYDITHRIVGGETVLTAPYCNESTEVYVNGLRMVKDDDYAIANYSHVAMMMPPMPGDIVQIISYDTVNVMEESHQAAPMPFNYIEEPEEPEDHFGDDMFEL